MLVPAGGLDGLASNGAVNHAERQFQTVGNTELIKDNVQVVPHCLFADGHLLGYVLVLEPLHNKAHKLAFARTQNEIVILGSIKAGTIGRGVLA